jgi:uncharacterized protein (TIGR02996 family)
MTDGEALVRAILENPDEDTPRLIYADWLDEQPPTEVPCGNCNGKPRVYSFKPPTSTNWIQVWASTYECLTCSGSGTATERRGSARAEFIRAQIKSAAIEREQAELLNDETDWSRCETESGVAASWCPNCGDCVCPDPEDRKDDPACPLHAPGTKHCRGDYLDRQLATLGERERELWSAGACFHILDEVRPTKTIPADMVVHLLRDRPDVMKNPAAMPEAYVSRGFISHVAGTVDSWPEYGPKIVGRHPIEWAGVAGREPGLFENTNRWYWTRETEATTYPRHTLPYGLLKMMAELDGTDDLDGRQWLDFPTKKEASGRLSRTLIISAREAAETST